MKKNERFDHLFTRRRLKVLLTMKFLMFFILVSVLQSSANVYSQVERVSVNLEKATFGEMVKTLEKTTGYTFLYRDDQVEQVKNLNLNYVNEDLRVVLDECLKACGLDYKLVDRTIVIVPRAKEIVEVAAVKKQRVTGTVTDVSGAPLPGVTVIIDGTHTGVATDIDGNYSIECPEGENVVLVFSFIGLKTQKVTIGKQTKLNVTLKDDSSRLDEVVVIGYGTSKAKDMTGAVSRISAEEMKTAPMGASVQNMLQGRAAGVNVMISSASPTSPVTVVIRGASSLSGDSQPLWVIDGVPQYITGTSGDVTNTLYNLNLNDVESIDILKDASATAIYGSRAANGVVLVTTKKGGEMEPVIEVMGRVGIQKIDDNGFSVMNKKEYIDFSKHAVTEQAMRAGMDYWVKRFLDNSKYLKWNTSQFDKSDYDKIFLDDAYYDGDTDWWDLMTQQAITQEYNVSLRGGNKKSSYYASFFFKDQDGIVKGSSSKNFGGRFNFESKIKDVLKMGINVDASARKTNNRDNMVSQIIAMRPDYPAYNEDGSINTIDSYVKNPLLELLDKRDNYGRNLSGSLFLEYDILPGLKFKTTGTINYAVSKSDSYERKSYDGDQSTASRSVNQNYVYVWENVLTYFKTFGKHDVQALLGYSMEKTESDGLSAGASSFPDDEILTDLGSASNMSSMSSPYASNALVSAFARVQYKYKERYLLTGTFRTDGSSRFGPDERWGYFPSGAIAWIMTEEEFMKGLQPYVSYLKLRFSMGLSGSQNLGNYDWRTLMYAKEYNGKPGIIPHTKALGNNGLKWEAQKQIDLGLDYGFWDERVRGSIGYYQKDVDNLLYANPVPPSSSYSSVTENIGAIRNKGIEFDIKADIIKKNDLTWDVNFNIARNIGTLEKLNGVDKYFGGGTYQTFKIKEGGELGEFYGYVDAGRLFQNKEEVIAIKPINPETGKQDIYKDTYENAGDVYLLDLDGDGKITADGDRTYLGSSNPDFFGGFGSSLYWKGIMFNLTFTYSYGGLRYWNAESSAAGGINTYNQHKMVLDSWTMGNGGDFPHVDYYGRGDNGRFSNRFLHDASFLRLSSMNLSYRLPQSWFGKSLIQGVETTFQATNLFTFTKYPGMDPQGNFSTQSMALYGTGVDYSTYPSAKTFNVSLKITFK